MRILPLMALAACDQPETVSWHQDVKPLVDTWCTRCHEPGGAGVGDFTDPAVVEAMAEVMLAQIDAGLMPPPAADPACQDYVGSERLSLPDEARDTLAAWIDAGKPLGEAEGAPVVEPLDASLADPDLVVMMPEPYTPTWWDEGNPGNEYRCFILDHERPEGFYVNAMAPVVGTRELVHHVVLFTIEEGQVPSDYDPVAGYDCIGRGMTDNAESMIAGWAPGALPVVFGEGEGIHVPGDHRLVLQMHYFQGAAEQPGLADRSGYAFRTLDAVDTGVVMYPLGIFNFRIPAGAAEHTDGLSFRVPDWVNLDVQAVSPHMHRLGRAYHGRIERGDGETECLIDGRFDFDNQLTYQYRHPVRVEGGDTISFECTWDNSEDNPDQLHDPPRDVRYGERTDEEMCFAFALMSLAP